MRVLCFLSAYSKERRFAAARRLFRLSVLVMLAAALFPVEGVFAYAQSTTSELVPSQQLRLAMSPFEAARGQQADLTLADENALKVGVAKAGTMCLLSRQRLSQLTSNPQELIALGRLCLFGRKYEEARQTAVEYLQITPLAIHKVALALLSEAYLGLGSGVNAAAQVLSIVRDYPYDVATHATLTNVVRSAALESSSMKNPLSDLCNAETSHTIPLLKQDLPLGTGSDAVSVGTVFSDAMRCLDLLRVSNSASAAALQGSLQAIAEKLREPVTVDTISIGSAFSRYTMLYKKTPVQVSIGLKIGRRGDKARKIHVDFSKGNVLLVPITTWAPDSTNVISELSHALPSETIYAVTSWAANSGDKDIRSSSILTALTGLAQHLPTHVSLLVVPNHVLTAFSVDRFPSGIVVRSGTVSANRELSCPADLRLVVSVLQSR